MMQLLRHHETKNYSFNFFKLKFASVVVTIFYWQNKKLQLTVLLYTESYRITKTELILFGVIAFYLLGVMQITGVMILSIIFKIQ